MAFSRKVSDPQVKLLGQFFNTLFSGTNKPTSDNDRIHREWDRQRAKAMSPSERDEIDAIFSRAL